MYADDGDDYNYEKIYESSSKAASNDIEIEVYQ